MNRIRRKEIARAIELVEEARGILEAAMEEEQEAYDSMPEGLQESEQRYVVIRERKCDGDLMVIGPYGSVEEAREHAQRVNSRVLGLQPWEALDLEWYSGGRRYDAPGYRLEIVWLYTPVPEGDE